MFIFVVKIMPFAIITLRDVYATDYNDFGDSSMSILSVRLQNRRECNGINMFSFCRFLYWVLLRFLGGATMFLWRAILWFSQRHQQNKTFAALWFLNFIIFYSERVFVIWFYTSYIAWHHVTAWCYFIERFKFLACQNKLHYGFIYGIFELAVHRAMLFITLKPLY